MNKLDHSQIKVLKYVSFHKSVTADMLRSHFITFDAVNTARELTRSPYDLIRCPSSDSGDPFMVNHRNANEFVITDKGREKLYNYRAERYELWKNRIGFYVMGFISGVGMRLIAEYLLQHLL